MTTATGMLATSNAILMLAQKGLTIAAFLEEALEIILSSKIGNFQNKGSIFLADPDQPGVLHLKTERRLPEPLREICKKVAFGHCLCGRAAATRETVFSSCIDKRHEVTFSGMTPHGHYCVPIKHQSELLGVLNLYVPDCEPHDRLVQEFVEGVAHTIGIVIAKRLTEERSDRYQDQSRAFYRYLDQSNLISRTDRFGVITDVNEEFCKISQYDRSELIGKPHNIVNSGAHPTEFWQHFWRTIQAGAMWEGEICNRAKDGSLYWVKSKIFPEFVNDGAIKGYISIRTDITSVKVLHAQMNISSKLAVMGELVAGIAHEINNPLAVIHGNLSILLRELQSGRFEVLSGLQQAKVMMTACDRVRRIVQGFKTFAHSDVKPDELVSVNQCVAETIKLVEQMFLGSGVKIEFAPADGPCTIVGSFGRLQQVLMNLLTNARDALHDLSSGSKKIKVAITRLDNELKVTVQDNGPGVPANLLNQLFEPFFTTKPPGKGTGLGLSLSRKLLAEMQGTIHLEEGNTAGATFAINLPLSTEDAPNSAESDVYQPLPERASSMAETLTDPATEIAPATNVTDHNDVLKAGMNFIKSYDNLMRELDRGEKPALQAIRQVEARASELMSLVGSLLTKTLSENG